MRRSWPLRALVVLSALVMAACSRPTLVPAPTAGPTVGPTIGPTATPAFQDIGRSVVPASLWAKLAVSGEAPAPMEDLSAAYSAASDRLIVFGGSSGKTYSNQTWVLTNASGSDGGGSSWLQMSTAGSAIPTARYASVVAYNASKNTLIVFGGVDTTMSIQMDLHLLSNADGTGNGAPTWTNPEVAGIGPGARYLWASGYDEASDTLILFGGASYSSSGGSLYAITWLIRNVTTSPAWQMLDTVGAPPARTYESAVYDAAGNRLLLFGGNTSPYSTPDPAMRTNDLWVLTNANGAGGQAVWNQWNVANPPDPRSGHTAVWDAANKRMFIFGGAGTDRRVRNDIWVLSNPGETGSYWAQYEAGESGPAARAYGAAVFAGSKNRLIILGGNKGNESLDNEVWALTCPRVDLSSVENIAIKGATQQLYVGQSAQLTAVAMDSGGFDVAALLYRWISANPGIATVGASGRITGVSPGSAMITIRAGSLSADYQITVVEAPSSAPSPVATAAQ